jgi:hypothetical protein
MFLTCFTLLMPAFSLLSAAAVLPVNLVSLTERSPTTVDTLQYPQSVASVLGFSPVTFSAQERLTSELLRTL